METKPTELSRESLIINTVSLLHGHVSTTLVAIGREMSYKGYFTTISRTNANLK